MLKEFKEFSDAGNVIDLAVAVVIGAAFGKIVASFVRGHPDATDWFWPLAAWIFQFVYQSLRERLCQRRRSQGGRGTNFQLWHLL